jgi:hypothetical protein
MAMSFEQEALQIGPNEASDRRTEIVGNMRALIV